MPPRHPIFVVTVVVLIGLCFGATPSAAQTDVIGQWSLVNPLPYYPVHTHMLPTGKVMIWPGDENGAGGPLSGNDPRSWDPANQSVSSLSKPGYNIFCAGHSFLADGTLFAAGGHIDNFVGLSRASIYNPFTNAWSNLPNMNAGRWYPTTTVLANGDVLVASGTIEPTIGQNTLPQVFQVATGTWRSLTSAQLAQDNYPWMLLAPNGLVFDAGISATTRYLNTSGTGTWTGVANRVGGVRDYGSAVMYAPGKVLVMGGDSPPKNTAEVIDLNAASPSWRAVDSMLFGRRHNNATLLPDGTVLVTGGTAAPGFNDPSGHVDAAELWDPATENWTTLASSSGIPRVYHSAALLLPDGRVLSTGGNGFPDTEIYSPPYLFKGTEADDHVVTVQRRLWAVLLRRNAGRRDDLQDHDAETLLGDSCFQPEPVHQRAEFFANHGRPQRHGPSQRQCCASWLLPALPSERERRSVRRQVRPARRHGSLRHHPADGFNHRSGQRRHRLGYSGHGRRHRLG